MKRDIIVKPMDLDLKVWKLPYEMSHAENMQLKGQRSRSRGRTKLWTEMCHKLTNERA